MALKFYKTESLIPGYKLGLNNDNLYVSVPKKYCKKYYIKNKERVNLYCKNYAKTHKRIYKKK